VTDDAQILQEARQWIAIREEDENTGHYTRVLRALVQLVERQQAHITILRRSRDLSQPREAPNAD